MAKCKCKTFFPLDEIPRGEFFATGTIKGPSPFNLHGVLTNDATGKETIGTALAAPRPHWVLFFQIENPDTTTTYTLKTYEGRPNGELLDEVSDLKYVETYGVSISNPVGTQCCGNYFSAQGALTPQDTAVTDATMTSTNSGTVFRPPWPPMIFAGNWMCGWGALPNDTYDLDVYGNAGGHANKPGLVVSRNSPPCP